VSLSSKLHDAWRKNSPELLGFFNGSFPDFVLARSPKPLQGFVPVFHYHLVETPRFEADLKFLSENNYTTIDADQMVDYLSRRTQLPTKSVLLTFDDGPKNFYEVAFPLLRKYRHKAVHFIAPALHEEHRDDFNPDWPRPMTWAQLREIHASGLVQIQSHTLESRYVPAWPRPAALAGVHPEIENARRGEPRDLKEDLLAAKQLLEERLPGSTVRHLAFPQYDGNDAAVRIAQEVGYVGLFWGQLPTRPMNRPGDSPLQITRISGEYLRRLPAQRRISLWELAVQRRQIINEGIQWRSKFAGS
jgi:peptidoglycan/xylan/chitin deacetylase (PgdA/CDA1 family)